MAQLKLLQGYEGDLKTPSNPINEQEKINPAFSEGQLLFTIQDARLNNVISGINEQYGGYIYLDYLYNTKKYRLPMIAPYSDKASYEFTTGKALSTSAQANLFSMDSINKTTLQWESLGGDKYALACNYYPTNFTWAAESNSVTLSYLLQKGVNNNQAVTETIVLNTIPIATETSAGILIGESTDDNSNNTQYIGGIKKFTNLIQLIKGDNYPELTSDKYEATLTVVGGTHITQDVRIDGTHLLLNRTAKIECDAEKSTINFVFL